MHFSLLSKSCPFTLSKYRVVLILLWTSSWWGIQKHMLAQVPSLSENQGRFSMEHFTPANGLVADKVISVAQDTIGYIWIGTQQGLHRHDGYSLRLYQHDPEDSRFLSDNTVEKIYVDEAGSISVPELVRFPI